MNRQEAARLISAMMVLWPTQARHLTQDQQVAMADVWASVLEDVAYEAANAAVRALASETPFLPAISEIRRVVVELEVGPGRPGGDAWGDVLAAVHRYGVYRSPVFDDPVTARAVSSLGWQEICSSENQVADRARFIELYDHYVTENRRCAQSPMLAAARRERDRIGGPTTVKALLEAITQESGDE